MHCEVTHCNVTIFVSFKVKLVDSTSEILKNTSQDDVIEDWFEREFSDDDDEEEIVFIEVVDLTEMTEKEDITERMPVGK